MLFLSYHQKKKESSGIIIHGPTVSSLPYVIRAFWLWTRSAVFRYDQHHIMEVRVLVNCTLPPVCLRPTPLDSLGLKGEQNRMVMFFSLPRCLACFLLQMLLLCFDSQNVFQSCVHFQFRTPLLLFLCPKCYYFFFPYSSLQTGCHSINHHHRLYSL